jgi:hypothetical protein
MNLTKIARTLALGLIVSTAALTSSFAAPPRPCSCSYCPTVDPTTNCKSDNGTTTCGAWLSVTLCPAQ